MRKKFGKEVFNPFLSVYLLLDLGCMKGLWGRPGR